VRWLLVGGYLLASGLLLSVLLPRTGAEIFPPGETRQLQLRLRAPTGTRLERTELITLKAMDVIKDVVGSKNVDITTGFVGVPTPNYPINTIYLFTSGQHEAVLGVALKTSAPPVTEDLKETLRRKLNHALPNVTVSFEAGDIISQVMSFGNIHGKPLGSVVDGIRQAIARAGAAPRGVNVITRGQIPAFEETLSGLRTGLLLSIVVIFLLLSASFPSFRLAFAVMSAVPAVMCGVLVMLLLTGTTLNVQSFMGAIMAIGISVANAILLLTFAEHARRDGASVHDAAVEGGRGRLRAILMTASAMIAGMIPIAVGTGERAYAAPLGRAVIGGLVFATAATLVVLPAVYTLLQARVRTLSPTLDPDDPTSAHHDPRA
jgi:multidrug efflux pump subunit AcrB